MPFLFTPADSLLRFPAFYDTIKETFKGGLAMQKVVYISNSRDFTEPKDINDNQYLVRLNKLLEEGWVISQMNTRTVEVDPKLESYLHKETLVSFVILEKPDEK